MLYRITAIILTFVIIWLYWQDHQALQQPLVIENQQFQPTPEVADDVLIAEINKKNQQITSFFCDNIQLLVQKELVFKLQAEIYYEKPKNFRMLIGRRILGREVDLGSNQEQFWYWSKRMQPPGLYYSTYADLAKTRLKTPFQPLWMMETLGFGEISTTNIRKLSTDKYLLIIQDVANLVGQPLQKMTLLDRVHKRIVGHYIYQNNKLIVASEIKEFQDEIPIKIYINWAEEDTIVQLTFNKPTINVALDRRNWEKPKKSPEINMVTCSENDE